MNAMSYVTQFFVSTVTTETHAEHPTKILMNNFVLSFGMVAIPVVDTRICFKSVFKGMCAALGIVYWNLSCGNHKGTSIERYHFFLNKT